MPGVLAVCSGAGFPASLVNAGDRRPAGPGLRAIGADAGTDAEGPGAAPRERRLARLAAAADEPECTAKDETSGLHVESSAPASAA